MCNIKTIFTSFGQNTAEFHDKQSFTVLCIFCQEFKLKQRYICITFNGKRICF